MMEASLDKAFHLYRVHKYSLVLKEIDSYLSLDPENARAYALKALAYLGKKEAKEALENARKAVSLGPENDYHHYVLSLVNLNLTKDYKKAELSIKEALRLNPEIPDYYDVLALLKMIKQEYTEALALCEKGLELDPENADCLSTRARVLTKLGKKNDANLDLNEALRSDPENPQTLASAGWVRLENGDRKGALEAFRDSLKIQPDNEYARNGLIQALKARSFLFRQYLKYVFWLSRLGKGWRWGLIIGIYVLVRLLSLSPAMLPILGLYILFVLSIWLVDPIFNLFLRLDRYGKYALNKSEIIASNLVAAAIVLAIITGILAIVVDLEYLITGAAALLLMTIPISVTSSFYMDDQRKYRKSLIFTIVLCATMLAGLILVPFSSTAGAVFLVLTIVGEVLFSWLVALSR
jgi:tetratricopeptide (TPR) repeat protein